MTNKFKNQCILYGSTLIIAILGFLLTSYLDQFVIKAEYNADKATIQTDLKHLRQGQHEIKEILKGR